MNGKNAWIPLLLLMPLSIGNVYVARRQVGNALFARWQFGGVAGDPRLCKTRLWPGGLTTWANRLDSVPEIVPVPPNPVPDRPVPPCRGVCPPPPPRRPDTVGDVVIVEPISPPWRPLEPVTTEFTVDTTRIFHPFLPTPEPQPDPPVPDSSGASYVFALLPLASLAGAASTTRANVAVAVVPEPGTLGLLSTGIALLIPLGMIRRRRARRADSGAAERAE